MDPLQIDIGTTAPGGDALIEIAAGNERIGGRIAKLRHARELHRREIRRFIDDQGSPDHLATFADDVVLYLLLAGLRVAYGGVIGHDALHNGVVEGDDINYVERLLAMVRAHLRPVSLYAVDP
jgi:hypothetical protein